jgi:hypothetical protein
VDRLAGRLPREELEAAGADTGPAGG